MKRITPLHAPNAWHFISRAATLVVVTALLAACDPAEDEDNIPSAPVVPGSLVGSWELPGGFNSQNPHFINFYANGQYAVYADCSQLNPPGIGGPLEIGTYVATNTQLTITSHIQNGCGGFDDDNNAAAIPPGPIGLAFGTDGNSVTLGGGLLLSRVQGSNRLVGAWDLPGGFDQLNPHAIIFLNNGNYLVYASCGAGEPLEIGTYTASDTALVITSHIQNGCGGFDDPNNANAIPPGPIGIAHSADSSTVTLLADNLVLTRVK